VNATEKQALELVALRRIAEPGPISDGDQAWLDDCFAYHSPTSEQQVALACVREAFLQTARVILQSGPASADRSAAMRCLRESRMWANAAIVREGRN
jgi:hypothetical protein